MTITNGYATLNEFKARWNQDWYTYTAATLSFASSTKTITDTARGLRRFQENHYIVISGSTSNDGYYTVTTGNVPSSLVVSEALVTEAAGDTVTITVQDPTDDPTKESVIEAASRVIDDFTGRHFYRDTETRYYTPSHSNRLFVEDLGSVTTLKTDDDGDGTYENTWAATDYVLLPANASTDGEPYTSIEVALYGSYSFPTGVRNGVQLAGSFGYSATAPTNVHEACLLLTQQILARKDAPFGVIAAPGGGALLRLAESVLASDGHLIDLLAGVRRLV